MNTIPARKKSFYPLTFHQKEIWYMEALYPKSSIANIAATLRFYGKVDLKLIKRVLNIIIAKNDGLRIRFRENKGKIEQYIAPYSEEIKIHIFNFRRCEKEEIYKKSY